MRSQLSTTWARDVRAACAAAGAAAPGETAAEGAATRAAVVRDAVISMTQERLTRCMDPPSGIGSSLVEGIRLLALFAFARIFGARDLRSAIAGDLLQEVRWRRQLSAQRDRSREPVGDTELAVGVLEVLAHRARRHAHPLRDLPVGETGCHQLESAPLLHGQGSWQGLHPGIADQPLHRGHDHGQDGYVAIGELTG